MPSAKSQQMTGEVALKPVRPKSLDSAVLDELASYVDGSGMAPGSKLPSERELCEVLGVGRSTVREALKRWKALGIVEMRHAPSRGN